MKNESESPNEELESLLESLANRDLTEVNRCRLQTLLEESDSARSLYIRSASFDAMLAYEFPALLNTCDRVPVEKAHWSNLLPLGSLVLGVSIFLILAGFGAWFWTNYNDGADKRNIAGQPREASSARQISSLDYDLVAIPIRTVGYTFTNDQLKDKVGVEAGTRLQLAKPLRFCTVSGSILSPGHEAVFATESDDSGVLFSGRVDVTSREDARYSVTYRNLRVVGLSAQYWVEIVTGESIRVHVFSGQVSIQTKSEAPKVFWTFDAKPSAADLLPLHLVGASTQTRGILGDGALECREELRTYAIVEGGLSDVVGAGQFSFSSGLTIEAVVQSSWDAKLKNQDTIFRKEDGPNRLLLGLQNNKQEWSIPRVPLGPCLSFGIFLDGLGYSELDMPLDGREGRPSLLEFVDGRPHHVVATYDSFSGKKSIAIDGQRCFQHVFPVGYCIQSGGPCPVKIGGWLRREAFSGVIDEVALYDHAMSEPEIARHFEMLKTNRAWLSEYKNSPDQWVDIGVLKSSERGVVHVDPKIGLRKVKRPNTNSSPLDNGA